MSQREIIDRISKTHFFYHPTSSVYNGYSGFFDFGPLGTKLLKKIQDLFREVFIDSSPIISEISTSLINPRAVFEASGHLEKFEDFMAKDSVTGDVYRTDKFLIEKLDALLQKKEKENNKKPSNKTAEKIKEVKEILEKVESLSVEELDKLIVDFKFKSSKGNPLTPSYPFNLMFKLNVGPVGSSGANTGYLRPETAQSIFQNFPTLNRLSSSFPFGSSIIEKGFRNEISPRSGILRCREFEMAEIEFFYNDSEKIPEESLENFFLETFYCDVSKYLHKEADFKFSQKSLGMADLNLEEENGKKSLFDLYSQGIIENVFIIFFMAKTIQFSEELGISEFRFREHEEKEMAHYSSCTWDWEINTSYGWIECGGISDRGCFDLSRHDSSSNGDFKVNGEIPKVVEPSFGINRIFYAVLESSLKVKENKRNVLSFPLKISPNLFSVIPLYPKDAMKKMATEVFMKILAINKDARIDLASQNMGKKYARADEIGTKFVFTIDHTSLEDKSITVRERDSWNQGRLHEDKLEDFINWVVGRKNWDEFEHIEILK